MIDAVAEVVGERRATVAVHHVDNYAAAVEIEKELAARLPEVEATSISDMGPVLSVHVGSGAVGVCVTVDGEDAR